MGERSLYACVVEQLDVLREAARLHSTCGFSLQNWYDDGADLKGLYGADAMLGRSEHEDAANTDITYAWGYLSGCADHCDLTVSEYLDTLGLTFDPPGPTKRQKIRRVR